MDTMKVLQADTVAQWVPVCEAMGILQPGMKHTGGVGYEIAVQNICTEAKIIEARLQSSMETESVAAETNVGTVALEGQPKTLM